MANANSKEMYIPLSNIYGNKNADGTYTLNALDIKNLNDNLYAIASKIMGGLTLADMTSAVNQTFTDTNSNVTELTTTAEGLTVDVQSLAARNTVTIDANGLHVEDKNGATTTLSGNHIKSGTIEGVTFISDEEIGGILTGYSVTTENGTIRLDGAGSATSFIKEDVNGLTIYNVLGGMISINNSIGTVQLVAAIVKLISSGNVSIDSGGTIYIGASSGHSGNVNVGQTGGTVNINGNGYYNGAPLGAAVFT